MAAAHNGDDISGDFFIDRTVPVATVEIEDAIRGLDDIVAVRLVPGTNRAVDELHVVVPPSRDPKATARDLQTLLLARFGVEVDRRVISVARLGGSDVSSLQDGAPRLMLGAVHVEIRASDTSVTVELLTEGGQELTGDRGPVADHALVEAVAGATIEALPEVPGRVLYLRGTSVCLIGEDRIAVVVIESVRDRGTVLLTGSAVVRRGEPDAVARAVLDATNRLRND